MSHGDAVQLMKELGDAKILMKIDLEVNTILFFLMVPKSLN